MAYCALEQILFAPQGQNTLDRPTYSCAFIANLSTACTQWLCQALTLAFTLTVTVKREEVQPHTASSSSTTTSITLRLQSIAAQLTTIAV